MVRTRIAPSPTGFPHLGLIYQAIFDYVLAHTYKGLFVLRIEDTDKARFVEGAEAVIYDALQWVNLIPDEGPKEGGPYGPYRQSERLDLYQKYANELIEKRRAYRCFCTKERLEAMRKSQEANHQPPMYDKTCRNLETEDIEKKLQDNIPYTIRMKMPENEKIVVNDALVGDVTFESSQIDDQVLLKSDGYPTYHLAVVVDDYHMKITHVIRGTEWLPSFPKHVLLWEYLGWKKAMPLFIHVPVLLNSEGGGKLSKRHAHTSVTYYQQEGFLPEAVVNYLANIVWNHPEGKEIFPLMDFGKALEIDPPHFALKAQGVHFNLQKLTWINGEYIRMMSVEELMKKIKEYEQTVKKRDPYLINDLGETTFRKLVTLAQTRMSTLQDFFELARYFMDDVQVSLSQEEKEVANILHLEFEKITDWNKESILVAMRVVLQSQKIKGSVLYKIITGQEHGLPLPESLEILGKEKTLQRLEKK